MPKDYTPKLKYQSFLQTVNLNLIIDIKPVYMILYLELAQ